MILDHFGSEKIKSKHISNLINNQNKLIFLSKKKLKKSKFVLLNSVNLKIGFINNLNLKEKKNLANKEVFLGDTDIFITIGKV